MKTVWLGIIVGTLLVGCGTPLKKRAVTPEKAQEIGLHRIYQRIVRYNCVGAVTSDKYETTQSPRQLVRINPRHPLFFHNATFINQTNGDTGCQFGHYLNHFVLDDAPGFCSMEVERGLNRISYQFSYCVEDLQSGECKTQEKIKESGALYVNIKYTEQTIHEPQHIHPTPEECKKPLTPDTLADHKLSAAEIFQIENWLMTNRRTLRVTSPEQLQLPSEWRPFLEKQAAEVLHTR